MGDYESAYILLGHGGEGNGVVKVPPRCGLVVDVHTGERAYHDNISKVMSEISLGRSSNKLLLNPEKHYEKVLSISQSGSLAIYKEGDECPNFKFQLLSLWEEPNIMLSSSGLIQYPFKFRFIPIQTYGEYENISFDHVVQYFRGSVYPTEENLREFQSFLVKEFDMPENADIREWLYFVKLNPTKIGKVLFSPNKNNAKLRAAWNRRKELEATYTRLLKYMTISLSDIFEMMTDGRLERGVLYNIVCRATSQSVSDKALNTEITFGKDFHVSDFLTNKADRLFETLKYRKKYVPRRQQAIYKKLEDRFYNNNHTNNNLTVLRAMNNARRRKNKGLRWIKTENGKWVEAPTFTQKVKGKIQNFFTRKRRSNTNTNSGSNTNTLSISSGNTSPKGRIPNHTRRSRLHNLLPPVQSP